MDVFADFGNMTTEASNLTEVRLLCHQYIYNDINNIEVLKAIIAQYIDSLSIDYDEAKKTISIRIKKTSMKKNPNFDHNPIYYYDIFGAIFRAYLNTVAPQLDKVLASNGFGSVQTLIFHVPNLSTMYNLTCISDNIIMVYL